jgi:hypothetical protein
LQINEATDAVKDAHLFTCVWHVLESYIKKDFLFYKPIDGKAMSLEVFNVINHFLEKNEINWEN